MGDLSLLVAPQAAFTVDGGVARINARLQELVRDLAERVLRVRLLVAPAPHDDSQFYPGGRSVYTAPVPEGVDVVALPYYAYRRPAFKAWTILTKLVPTLWRAVRDADLVFVFMPTVSGWLATVCARRLRTPYVLYFGADWKEVIPFNTRWGPASPLPALYSAISGVLERSAGRGALFSLGHGGSTTDRLLAAGSSAYPVAPMVDVSAADAAATREVQLHDPVRLLSVCAVIPRKGLEHAVAAVGLLTQWGHRVELTVAGSWDSRYLRELVSDANRLGVADRCHFIGHVTGKDAMGQLYDEADILVLPTLGEGFPRVVYEAQLRGLPVVASRIPSIESTLPASACAMLAEPRNPRSLAEVVRRVIGDESLRSTLSANGQRWACERLGGSTADQVLALIESHLFARTPAASPDGH